MGTLFRNELEKRKNGKYGISWGNCVVWVWCAGSSTASPPCTPSPSTWTSSTTPSKSKQTLPLLLYKYVRKASISYRESKILISLTNEKQSAAAVHKIGFKLSGQLVKSDLNYSSQNFRKEDL